jgi:hypothetical protein
MQEQIQELIELCKLLLLAICLIAGIDILQFVLICLNK